PYPASHQLERAGGDFLTGAGHADNHRLAPTLMAAFQRRTHHIHITDALERIIHAAVGQLNDHVLNRLVEVLRINAVGGAEFFRQLKFAFVDINTNYATSFDHGGADNGRQTNAAETENRHGGALFYLGGIQHCAHAGGDTATEQTDFFQRRHRVYLGQGNFRQHGVFRERRAAHVVENG